jgi:hypothetical protein
VELTVRLMLKAQKVYFTRQIGYNYLRHTGTITKPLHSDKLKKYLSDSITVALLIKNNVDMSLKKEVNIAIQKNYNSVIWNLIWRFFTKKEVDRKFVRKCIKEMRKNHLFPIAGHLKTKFQYLTCLFFNIYFRLI